jgi:MFS family permease
MSSPRSLVSWPSTESLGSFILLSEVQALKLYEKLSRSTLFPSLPSHEWKRGVGFWRSFLAICISLLPSALEGSVTNTALPTISDALDLDTRFSGVTTAVLLSGTVFQPLYSQLGGVWGRKYSMMLAVAVLAIGSAICGAANFGAVLIFGRIFQGPSTGVIDLFAEMILCDIIPLRKRGPYFAIKHVTFAVGITLDPLLGGVFAEHGWRWCFLVNIPICGISLAIIWFYLNVRGGAKASDVNLIESSRRSTTLDRAFGDTHEQSSGRGRASSMCGGNCCEVIYPTGKIYHFSNLIALIALVSVSDCASDQRRVVGNNYEEVRLDMVRFSVVLDRESAQM